MTTTEATLATTVKVDSAEVLAFLEEQAAKGTKGWLERLPSHNGAGTHPALYALYKEYVASGAFPYLDSVQLHVCDVVTGLPPFDPKFRGNEQPDPLQRQLQSEIYVASQQYQAEQESARAGEYAAEGYLRLTDALPLVVPDGVYLLRHGRAAAVRVRAVFQNGKLWGFLPPRKRTHGWALHALNGSDVYIKPE